MESAGRRADGRSELRRGASWACDEDRAGAEAGSENAEKTRQAKKSPVVAENLLAKDEILEQRRPTRTDFRLFWLSLTRIP